MQPPYLNPRPTFAYKQRACSSMCSTHDKLPKGRFSRQSVLLTLPLALPTTPESTNALFPAYFVYMSPSCVRPAASRSSYSSVLSSISLRLAQLFVCDTCHFTQGEQIVHIPPVEDKLKFTRTIVGKLTLLRSLLSFVWLIGIKADRGDFSLRTSRPCGEQDLSDSSRLPLRFPLPLSLRTCSPSSSVINWSICCSRLERSYNDRSSYIHYLLATACHNACYSPSLRCRVCVCQCLGFRETGNRILCSKCQWWVRARRCWRRTRRTSQCEFPRSVFYRGIFRS